MAAIGVSHAQVSGSDSPVLVGGDSMHMDELAHTQTVTGRVEVTQDDARLRADKVVITRQPGPNGKGFGEVITMVATGNIYYVTSDSTMKGDLAVYTKATDQMVVTGDVILTQNQNVTTGTRLVYDLTQKTTNFDADAGSGRVKAVIYSDKK
ncbi:MAG: lipopolysaccharide transport periplasmic protein LptA [Asticcacaulis sp.]|uniref:lipopolysaccharide transport periplasmic protein LptA n=1 Tax=Asticcacaulis sp. TaxID=1872648 RepID=UPI0039E34470